PGRARAAASEKALASIASLAWMTGCWSGVDQGMTMEECWLAPGGGILVGMHRDITPAGRGYFEFLRIAATGDTVNYWGSPMGKTPVAFRLKEQGPRRVVFENAAHDYPQRIIYWMDGDETLRARSEGTEKGAERGEEWAWKRSESPAPAGSRASESKKP
ncbi:MAG TPA: DUF6265 family protein, partial [Candidatus Eisenbacteria bacterium]|nr:DUF6265 family protein [Candidatus Eisenbacteria bacterium]